MTTVKLDKIYDALSWKDSQGSTWHKPLTSLHFAGTYGWAVGYGQILRIWDGGRSLLDQTIREISEGIIIPERVFTIDHQTAWIIVLSPYASRKCFYTKDGGTHWDEKRLPNLLHPNDISFFGDKLGWIISDNGDIPAEDAMIHMTSDGGENWESCQLEIKGRPRRLKFFTPTEGLLLQHTANQERTKTVCNLLISRDGGLNWRVLKSFNRLIADFFIADNNSFFVVGEGGFISSTVDGGLSWKRSYTKKHDCFNVIEFNHDGKGIAAGDFGLSLISEDAGRHWATYRGLNESGNIIDLSFVERDRAVIATSTAIFSMVFSQ